MRAIPVVVVVISFLFCFCRTKHVTQASNVPILMRGTIRIVNDYCGGAEPSEAQLHPHPVLAAGIKMYVKNGSLNGSGAIVDSIVSDAIGNFAINLLPGKYCMVEANKKPAYQVPKDDQFNTWDTACFRTNYLKCDYDFDLGPPNIGPFDITLYRHCPWTTPCDNYHGPLPPAAEHPHNE